MSTEAAIAERLIDVPLESLPYVDEHSSTSPRPPSGLGGAGRATSAATGAAAAGARIAGALRLRRRASARARSGEIGSTIPGFIVTRSVPPAVLALMGEHRFSRYALIFRITETPRGPVRLSAETRAEFPGRAGGLPGLVIGTRGHVIAARSAVRTKRCRAVTTCRAGQRCLKRRRAGIQCP